MAIPFRWRLRFLFLLNSVPVLCVVRRSNQGLGSRRVVGLEAKRAGQVLSPPSAMCLVKFGMAGGTRPVCVTLAMDGYGHRCCIMLLLLVCRIAGKRAWSKGGPWPRTTASQTTTGRSRHGSQRVTEGTRTGCCSLTGRRHGTQGTTWHGPIAVAKLLLSFCFVFKFMKAPVLLTGGLVFVSKRIYSSSKNSSIASLIMTTPRPSDSTTAAMASK